MIHLTAQTVILIASQPADFRKGLDGFIAQCQHVLQQQPRDGQLFVFLNRNRTMMRVLHYDGSGFWLHTKRLSKGRFQFRQPAKALVPLLAHELSQLIKGEAILIRSTEIAA